MTRKYENRTRSWYITVEFEMQNELDGQQQQARTQQSTAGQPEGPPPQWALALVRRIEALETHTRSDDPNVEARPPDTEFTPYPAFSEALPGWEKDFFRHPLPELAQRRFLADFPRNTARNYNPPVLNNVNVNKSAKRTDHQLSEIQFRLSGITRPLDNFVHKALQSNGPHQQQAIDFANVVHELLVDTASFITQLRVDNMFMAANIRGQAPRLGSSTTSPLLEPKDMVEYVKLAQAVQQTGQRHPRNRSGKAYSRSRNTSKSEDESHQNTNDHDSRTQKGYNWQRKDFHSGPRDKGKKGDQRS
ncbi:hypothetical protein BJV82DRAFT_661218 [Fennellomyces sp. T-0311]|nr:hypothetical protein BJV82DRAFT_661218 [Fennellomyces sp. T-0311]